MNSSEPGFMRRGWVGGALLLLLCCSCPSVRTARGYILEPAFGLEYWDSGNTTLGDSFYVGKVWVTLRRDDQPVSGVPAHPGFLDRYESDLARAREEAATARAAASPAAEVVSVGGEAEGEGHNVPGEMGGLIDAAEHGLRVAENATWAAVGRIIALLVALAAIGTGMWWVRRWWTTRSSSS